MHLFVTALFLLMLIIANGFNADGKVLISEGFIYGGKPAQISELPHQIALVANGYQICGGSIIAKKYVLTAAHCVIGKSRGLSVVYGTSNLAGGHEENVRQVYLHDRYNDHTLENDIAVLELVKPIRVSRSAKPIKLSAITPKAGAKAIVSGWGKTENGFPSQLLLKSTVDIVDRRACDKAYGNMGRVTPNMICASAHGKDACQGDSGGPLIVGKALVGVVSWGLECADPRHPGIYTNVAKYRKFIDSSSRHQAKWTKH